jgi:integrase
VSDLSTASRSVETRRSYASAWGSFDTWSTDHGLTALPASGESVALYLASLASHGRKSGTIARTLTAIVQYHRDRGLPSPGDDPVVRRVVRGIRRQFGSRQVPKSALRREDVLAMVATCREDVRGLRDRAILLLGFATGLRRSELVAVEVEHVAFDADGMTLLIPRSKTDPFAKGRRLRVRAGPDTGGCPVVALRAWLTVASVASGPIFRAVSRSGTVGRNALHPRVVERVVKRAAHVVGLNPRDVAAHSLRSGFATNAAEHGISEMTIAAALGHATLAMTRRYVRSLPTDAG